jgi:hypothetical protein
VNKENTGKIAVEEMAMRIKSMYKLGICGFLQQISVNSNKQLNVNERNRSIGQMKQYLVKACLTESITHT